MKIYGELLIFLLLLLTNLRVFFPKKTRKDPSVSLGPAALFLSILQIFAWKVDLITAYAFILSLILVLSNFQIAVLEKSKRSIFDLTASSQPL